MRVWRKISNALMLLLGDETGDKNSLLLRKKGPRLYRGCCPFCNEEPPDRRGIKWQSLVFNSNNATYRCMGCKRAGPLRDLLEIHDAVLLLKNN